MVEVEIAPSDEAWVWSLLDTSTRFLDLAAQSTNTPKGAALDLGLLFVLHDEGRAQFQTDRALVAHEVVATLGPSDTRLLGLPPVVPYHLRIRSDQTFLDSALHARWFFEAPDGRPIAFARRAGSSIRLDDQNFLLLDPLFALITRIEEFNSNPGSTQAERAANWAHVLAALQPREEVAIDGFLGDVRVVVPTVLRIERHTVRGESHVVPVLGNLINDDVSGGDASFSDALDADERMSFEQWFTRRDGTQRAYGIGKGVFVVPTDELNKVLPHVRAVDKQSEDKKRELVLRPQAVLKNILGEGDAAVVDRVIWDGSYSDRVETIGAPPKRVLPWIRQPPQAWLPPEELGITIGDEHIRIEQKDLEALQRTVDDALAKGTESVEYQGHKIPVTQETADALNALIGRISPNRPDNDLQSNEREARQPRETLVLVVTPNYEVVGYESARRERTTEATQQAVRDLLDGKLLDHQLQGLAWFITHWNSRSPGCLLADDMGLGKTFQTLAFLAWMRRQLRRVSPILIVAPTALMANWREEHDKWLLPPGLGELVEAHGRAIAGLRERSGSEAASGVPSLSVNRLRSAGWVLTTYETLRDYQLSFGQVRWAAVVLDEAQRIKHPDTGVSQAAKAMQAGFQIALTGTPVENRYADIWSIVDTVLPGRLGSLKEFSARYEKDLETSGPELRKRLVDAQPSIMLRRLKDDILEGLPEKRMQRHEETMPAGQAAAYESVIAAARGIKQKPMMLKVIQQLRSISLHPGVSGSGASWFDDDACAAGSARLSKTLEILDTCARASRKTLLFLESLELQGRLVSLLQRRFGLPTPPLVINGTVAGPDRQARVHEFQSRDGFDVMLLSPRAAGVGLNLTAATVVIHLSRWWNPAVEDQCTDRAYRLGQTSAVDVHYPMAVHPHFGEFSYDLRLDALMTRKRRLSAEILAAPTVLGEDVEQLFRELVDGG